MVVVWRRIERFLWSSVLQGACFMTCFNYSCILVLFHYYVRYIYKAQDCKYCLRSFYSLHKIWRPLAHYLNKENNPRNSKSLPSTFTPCSWRSPKNWSTKEREWLGFYKLSDSSQCYQTFIVNVVQLSPPAVRCSYCPHCFQQGGTVVFCSWDFHWKMTSLNGKLSQEKGGNKCEF